MSVSTASDRADEIRLLRDSVAAIVPEGGDLSRVRALRFGHEGFDRDTWRAMADLGWLGLRVPEARAGSGLGVAALCAVAEGLGAGLAPEPFVAAATIAPLLPDDVLHDVIGGERVILPAWQERANELGPPAGLLLGDRLSARRVFVPQAGGADAFLVAVGTSCALVDAGAAGLTVETTQDGGHFGTLSLQDAPVRPVAADIARVLDEATLGTAAYLLGVMERAFEITLDYLRTRQQFGRPIGSFQSLQHRAADLKIQVALTRASVEAAAAALDAGHPLARAAVSRAKARAAEAAMLVTRQAIQLHGGIGYTDEADIGLYLRKAMVMANLHGSAALHRARYAVLHPEPEDD